MMDMTTSKGLHLLEVDLSGEIKEGRYLCLCRDWGGPRLRILLYPDDSWMFEDIIRIYGPIKLPEGGE